MTRDDDSREFWPTSALGWFVVMPSAQGLRGWAAKLAIPRCTPGPNESARTHPVKEGQVGGVLYKDVWKIGLQEVA